jgi:hypothetical protein
MGALAIGRAGGECGKGSPLPRQGPKGITFRKFFENLQAKFCILFAMQYVKKNTLENDLEHQSFCCI